MDLIESCGVEMAMLSVKSKPSLELLLAALVRMVRKARKKGGQQTRCSAF